MAANNSQTAHKAHWTAFVMLLVQVVMAVTGVIDVEPSEALSDLKELLMLGSALLIPVILGWVTPYFVRNKPK